MLIRIPGLFEPDFLKRLQTELADPEQYQDGKLTAGWSAKTVKNNLQLKRGAKSMVLFKEIEKVLRTNVLFSLAARPKGFARIMVNRFEEGMSYGWHVDDPVISDTRTDLSFTVFLSDPTTYEGGELVIQGQGSETKVKLAAGDGVLYSTTALHQVAEVTSGVRLCVVGWVRSYIRLDAQRQIMFDLDVAARELFQKDGKSPIFDRISNAKSNLFRMWAED